MNLIRNEIFEAVRSEILSCALMPGTELREAELAKRYGVSQSPVRDAMRKLEYEGLVEIESRRGHRVRDISIKDAEDILDLRIVLDVGVVTRALEIAIDEQFADLDRFRVADMSSKEGFAAYNEDFHVTLASLANNRRLFNACREAMELYGRLCIVSLSTLSGEGGFEEPLADHIAIIDALQSRDADLAIAHVRRHVSRSRSQVVRGLQRRMTTG